ncbi:hypothetical protein [Helicobacter fennelliae]|nr:hypothetical protein [Helicobacter fennelliae]
MVKFLLNFVNIFIEGISKNGVGIPWVFSLPFGVVCLWGLDSVNINRKG